MMPFLVGILFLFFRFLYIPFLVVLVPINGFPIFPAVVYRITFFGLAVLYITLLVLPLFFGTQWCIKYKLWANSSRGNDYVIKRAKIRVKKRLVKNRIPQIIVVMPIYNEEPDALTRAVQSVVDAVYPSRSMAVYLSFDNDEESELYLHLMNFLTKGAPRPQGGYARRTHIIYQKVHFIINRFPHGGKRHTQALTFNEIKRTYAGKERGTFVLFIDSDIILYEDCMIEFVRAMEKNKQLVGMTGFISAISSKERNFYWYLQDCEYVVGQVFARSLEAALGGVTCLPGALTIIRLKELSKAAETYFSELDTDDIFDFHRYHLGEDRYLTHLLMEQSKGYSIGFCPSARAKTEAPGNWVSFLKQRRRWLLGAFSNEVYFLSDINLWRRVPMLLLYKTCDFASRSAAFFVYIVIFQLISGVYYSLTQTIIIWFPLTTNWLLLFVFSLLLRRFKVFYMYPIMMLLNPWLYFFINLYSIWTWNFRSWGGPRTNAVEGGEKDEEQGDEKTVLSAQLLALRQQASQNYSKEWHLGQSGEFQYDSSGSTSSLDSIDTANLSDINSSGSDSEVARKPKHNGSRISVVSVGGGVVANGSVPGLFTPNVQLPAPMARTQSSSALYSSPVRNASDASLSSINRN